jgi:hypothetical protein
MSDLFQNDVALMGPTKYFYVGCTIRDALRDFPIHIQPKGGVAKLTSIRP